MSFVLGFHYKIWRKSHNIKDFVHSDDGLAVAGTLTDENIFAECEIVDDEEGVRDEEDDVPAINDRVVKTRSLALNTPTLTTPV